MESSILSEVDDTSILRTGLPRRYACPLNWLPASRLLPRAAGWSAATLCFGSKPAVPSTTDHSRSTFNCGRTVTLPKPSRSGRNPEPETVDRRRRATAVTPRRRALSEARQYAMGRMSLGPLLERSCPNSSSDTASLTLAFAGLTQRTGRDERRRFKKLATQQKIVVSAHIALDS